MKFEPTFTMLDVDREIDRIVEKSEEFILKKLFTIGEKCVNYARSNHAYLDDTGNLTSSIGYAVYRDGKRIGVSAFESILGAKEGKAAGLDALDRIAEGIGKEWALVVVAGMKYAVYVEAKGYDVLSSSKLVCEMEAKRLMSELKTINI
ncbi:MAG: hypothetical protein ACOX19_05730 [Fermentimonas sp.]|jgi:hypothetical protein